MLSAVCALALPAADASPWPRGEGRLFVSTKANYFRAGADAAPPLATGRPFYERIDSDLYAEYGLFEDLTLGAKIVYGNASYFDGFAQTRVDGIAEIEASVQYSVFNGRHGALSVKATGITPTRFEEGGRPGVFSDGVDAELRVLYGRTLAERPFKIYATAEAAYRRRFGDGADQARADFLVGFEPVGRVLALLEAQSRLSLRNERPGGADYDVTILQPSLVYRPANRWAVQGGVSYEAAGRNLERGVGYFLALWTEF